MTASLSGWLIGAWLLLEVVLRNGQEARSWSAGHEDRSTTRLIVGTYALAFIGPFLLEGSGFGAVTKNSPVAWVGVAVGASGLGVRIWSMWVLGPDYTRSLRTRRNRPSLTEVRTERSAIRGISDRSSCGPAVGSPSTGSSR